MVVGRPSVEGPVAISTSRDGPAATSGYKRPKSGDSANDPGESDEEGKEERSRSEPYRGEGAGHVCLYRGGTHTHHCSRLGVGHLLLATEYERGAPSLGKIMDGLADRGIQLGQLQESFGIDVGCGRCGLGHRVAISRPITPRALRLDVTRGDSPMPANVYGAIARCGEEKYAEGPLHLEVGPIPPDPEENVVNRVFGLRLVAERGAREAHELRVVIPKELLERARIARADAIQDFAFLGRHFPVSLLAESGAGKARLARWGGRARELLAVV